MFFYMADVLESREFPELHEQLDSLPFARVAIPGEKATVDICYIEDIEESTRLGILGIVGTIAPYCIDRMRASINDAFRGEKNRKVYFLRMKEDVAYSKHTHPASGSEGFFMPLKGSGIFVRDKERVPYRPGNLIEIPPLCQHGFVRTDEDVVIIAQQSQTIYDPETMVWDYVVDIHSYGTNA